MWIYFSSLLFFFGVLGIGPWMSLNKYQRDLDMVGLKNALGVSAKVAKIERVDADRVRLLVKAKGIGLEKFESKRGDLASSFEKIVDEIKSFQNHKFIEIYLSQKTLPTKVSFSKLRGELKKPYHLLIGQGRKGVIQDSILKAPHYLICGSTGGGKSVFFNNALLSLARSSLGQEGRAAIQFYLLDLKKGVEVKAFDSWPNVVIAKDEEDSLKVLRALRGEMHERYLFLEKAARQDKQIDPHRDQKDIIILGIDEASVLFGKTKNKMKAKIVDECRDLFDELCKLARASGIHIIAATQKPLKESLDTRALENLVGRVAFKMSSQAGSLLALGNGMAYKLPNIKGRCIWAGGNQFLEVQTPFLREEEIRDECHLLAEEFKKISKANYQKMLCLDQELEIDHKLFEKGLVFSPSRDEQTF